MVLGSPTSILANNSLFAHKNYNICRAFALSNAKLIPHPNLNKSGSSHKKSGHPLAALLSRRIGVIESLSRTLPLPDTLPATSCFLNDKSTPALYRPVIPYQCSATIDSSVKGLALARRCRLCPFSPVFGAAPDGDYARANQPSVRRPRTQSRVELLRNNNLSRSVEHRPATDELAISTWWWNSHKKGHAARRSLLCNHLLYCTVTAIVVLMPPVPVNVTE
jgi:hypothetical protein